MKGHTDYVNSVGFNHDGTKIVSGSFDNTIRVWNVDTGECILTLKGHTSYVLSVGFNHDGTKIVSGSVDETIHVWNIDTAECILTLKDHTYDVYSVGFNHDGTKIVSGSDDNTIHVWNVDTGECIFNGKQLEDTLQNEFNRTLQAVTLEEHFNYDTKSIIGMSGEGLNIIIRISMCF